MSLSFLLEDIKTVVIKRKKGGGAKILNFTVGGHVQCSYILIYLKKRN